MKKQVSKAWYETLKGTLPFMPEGDLKKSAVQQIKQYEKGHNESTAAKHYAKIVK